MPSVPSASSAHVVASADHEGDGRRGRLWAFSTLLVMAVVFSYSAWSWVHFWQRPDVAGGDRVTLFTQTDFPSIVIASRLVASGRGYALYDLDAQLQEQQRLSAEGYLHLPPGWPLEYPYPYTPFIAVLWSPLSGLPPLTQMALWDLLNMAGMGIGLWLLLSRLPVGGFTRLAFLLAALTCTPFIVNLEQGQSSGLVMLAMGAGIALLRSRAELAGGLVVGLLVFKIQWLPLLLLVLLFKGRWRALAGMAATCGALLSVTVLTIGIAWAPAYVQLLNTARAGGRELELDLWYGHGLAGGLAALLSHAGDAGGPVLTAITYINALAMLFVAVLLLYLWRGAWYPDSGSGAVRARWDGLMAVTVTATMFTNLQLNTHDLALLALPAALGTSCVEAHSGTARRALWLWYALLWAAYLVPSFALYTNPVRLTTLTVAAMLIFLASALSLPVHRARFAANLRSDP